MKTALKQSIAAPHRLGFLAGSGLLLLCFIWWGAHMLGRWQGVVLPSAVLPMFLHGYSMTYCFFPLFMLGFIYTAGPRWLSVPSPRLHRYLPIMLGYLLGGIAVIASAFNTSMLMLGVSVQAVAWLAALCVWLLAIKHSHVKDQLHARLIALAFALGWIGMLLALLWAVTGNTMAWLWSVQIGVWGLLLPVFLAVSHRMIPFFSGSVLQPYRPWRPSWWLYTLVGCSLLRIVLIGLQINTVLVDAIMAGVLLYTTWRWDLHQSFRVKLLAMLHAAFAWAGVAMLLATMSEALKLFGHHGLGFAPLHALTLGFFCCMLLAFVTRVTLGHSGRPLIAGGMVWTCYWAMHGVALARVLGEVLPVNQAAAYALAVLLALLALFAWSRVYLPMYWQARVDGAAG
ncbi:MULTISPECIES: NnrS family protein [Deefgea]|uniref:NnrS family protein n=1 Tax=Deefgea chitinilytica TaxID=570276 RepID=A0ABS2CCE2_9NEIS|nr:MULTISPECIES: NnrS family protein [Deefgea]MBM5571118.1 NnrS family protein [Deefgea chitinilytica]MBM9888348.1 NnrS family protein [Deefgea sp. CFH1-16]